MYWYFYPLEYLEAEGVCRWHGKLYRHYVEWRAKPFPTNGNHAFVVVAGNNLISILCTTGLCPEGCLNFFGQSVEVQKALFSFIWLQLPGVNTDGCWSEAQILFLASTSVCPRIMVYFLWNSDSILYREATQLQVFPFTWENAHYLLLF